MERLCLDCRSPIKGRTDKKFCDDNCRSSFNNVLRAENDSFLAHINLVLKKNRKILKENNPNGKIRIKKELLTKSGFDFDYHTHTYTNKKGDIYLFCYEFGYLNLGNEEILVVKWGEK